MHGREPQTESDSLDKFLGVSRKDDGVGYGVRHVLVEHEAFVLPFLLEV